MAGRKHGDAVRRRQAREERDRMTQHRKRERVLWPFALLMYSAYNIGGHLPHGSIIAYTSVLMFLLALLMTNGFFLRVKVPEYHIYILLFAIFCLATTQWANNKNLALNIGIDLCVIFVLSSITCLAFQDADTVDPLLKLLMWSGFVVAAYGALFYGFGQIWSMLTSGVRISNDAMNANTLGMMSAFAVLINFYYFLKEKRIPLYSVFSVLALLMLAVSESRKALAIVVGGVFMLIVLNSFSDRNSMKRILKLLGAMMLFVLAFILAMRLSVFSGIKGRVQTMLSAVTGEGTADYSTVARGRLAEIGFEIFKEHPVLGIGMDNARLIAGPLFNRDEYYLHNNYVELLADGGLVGFLLYYSMFAYLLAVYLKRRDFRDTEYNICLILLLLRLVVDVGVVSYNGRLSYLLILIILIKSRIMKRDEKQRSKMTT